MKILYHHRTLGDGAEGVHVSSIEHALRELGHSVRVCALIGGQTNVQTTRTRFLTSIRRALPRSAYEIMELGYNVVGRRALLAAIEEWQPDILYERYILFNFAGVSAAKKAGLPIILEVNAPLAYERAAYESLTLKGLARRCEREICARATLVLVVSTPLKEHLVREGVAADRIMVLPNGADPDVFKPDAVARAEVRAQYGIPSDAVVIGFTGILRPWHGLDLLVRALPRLTPRPGAPLPYLLIVGDGPSRIEIERLAGELGVRDRLIVTGRVDHGAVPRHVAAFDIGVSPRATFYASPMKVPEYMAAGAAVIAPLMPNLEDLVTSERTGLLFTPENVDALTAELQRLVSDPELRTRLAQAGREAVLTGGTWKHNAERMLRALEQVKPPA